MAKKTRMERMREARRLMEQMEGLGLGPHLEAICDFQRIVHQYIQDGKGECGIIPLPEGTDRAIVYDLSATKEVPCTVVLKSLHRV